MIDFISILKEHLPKFQKVLELGSNKGDDLKLLDEYYEVIASEDEKVKTRYLKDTFIDIRVILVDKIELDLQKKFDCIFSNEKLDKYSLAEIELSFENQKKLLNKDGIIFHIFDSSNIDREEVLKTIKENYILLKNKEIDNKFYILARKKS
ncbi:hypothetical protein [Arcobacter sp. LA11]|uniref:hypothetical protein n=1 Tax=Arcobacter sp. LA11 TaxID=1898176 RepID=UPI000932557B|nr:hypothetical protein [Arcobacter sp. LA11]